MRKLVVLVHLAALAAACDCEGGGGIHPLTVRLALAPESLDFERVAVGNERVLELTAENTGETEVTIAASAIDGLGFDGSALTDVALAPQEQRQWALRFAPPMVGRFEGTATLTVRELTEPLTVSLVGEGVTPALEVLTEGERCGGAERSIAFGAVPVGTTRRETVTLRSIGTATTTVLGAQIESTTGELTVAGALGQIPPGASMTIEVAYAPVDVGGDSGTLVVETDAVGEREIRVPLCGEGARAGLCGRPVPIDLGRVALGTTAQAPFTLENCGTQAGDVTALAIDAASAPGLALSAPAVPAPLVVSGSMSMTVSFTPTALGRVTAELAVQSTAGNDHFPIVARAVEPCELDPLPASLDFGTVAPGATAERNVVMVNNSPASCTLERAEITVAAGTFTLVAPPSTPRAVAPGASETLVVRYAPASAQAAMGTLEVEAGRSVRQIPLSGNTPAPPGCRLEATPSPVAFGIVGVNQTATRMLTVRNVSTVDCHISAVALDRQSDPGFVDPALGASTLGGGQALTVNLTYRPTAPGSGRGTLRVNSDDARTPMLDVPLTATAQGPNICVVPRRLSFGNVQGSRDLQFQITACGSAAVTVTGLPFSRMDRQFTLVSPPTLPLNLPSGATQAITVRYTPTSAQGAVAAVDVVSNDLVSPTLTVDLEGGAQIVPPAAGRYLYYWKVVSGLFGGGDVMRLPLQGAATATPYWGVSTGRACSGCHALSPDGRYLALVNSTTNFGVEVVDTTTNQRVPLGFTVQNALLISWRPNVNTMPPYQFAFDDGERILIASVPGGLLGPLTGADTPGFKHKMPSWGSDGKIAFVRGTREATPFGVPAILGFGGSSDVMLVDEGGGSPAPLAGASGNGRLNYYPAHSPNGRWIAFTQSSGQSTYAAADARIAIVAADNSGRAPNLGQLNGGGGGSSFPTWSHDGAFISFSSNRAGGLGDWDLWFAPIDPMTGVPGAAMNLRDANTPGFDHVARWSP